MTALSRGFCPVCGRQVALRKRGLVREHRSYGSVGPVCIGAGRPGRSTPPLRGAWTKYDRMRGAGWTMAHFQTIDEQGFFAANACGYDQTRGLTGPRMVRIASPDPGDPRCSRCEARVSREQAA
jgi:hypothetical protein